MHKDFQAYKLNSVDAIGCSRWKKLIWMVDDQDGCEYVNVECFLVPAHPGSPGQRDV